MTQVFHRKDFRRFFTAFAIAFVVLTVTGPFGTYADLPLLPRMLYWLGALAGCGLFFQVTCKLAIHSSLPLPRAGRMVVGTLLGAPGATAVIYGLEQVFREGMALADAPELFGYTVVIGLIIGTVNFLPPFVRIENLDKGTEFDPAEVPFLERLPAEIGHDLIALSMQDHYVNVTTTQGQALIHMRFGDAVAELTAYPGRQIHRSHWIGLAHLSGIKKSGRQHTAELRNGVSLPVSARFLAPLQNIAKA